jgi:Ca-activated chloride channel family protein
MSYIHPSTSPTPQTSALVSATGEQVALRGVQISAHVHATNSRVTVRQRYVNLEDKPIEATYLFPLEDEAAVVGFRVETEGRVLKGVVKEREEAFKTYDDALQEGHGAYLLDQERPNAFTAQVGNLKPGQEAIIEVEYVSTLRVEGGRVRLLIPTVVAPRYVPKGPQAPGMSEEERWQAPRAGSVPYGLELSVSVQTAGGLGAVESPSHPIRLSLSHTAAQVSLSSERAALDRDFILLFDAHPSHEAGVAVIVEGDKGDEGDGGAALLSCTFTPRLPQDKQVRTPQDITFVIDCSGSMSGDPIEQARRAVGLFLRGLSEGDRFNICCFGSAHQLMWPEPRLFSQETLKEALAYLSRVDANLGGTEILKPIQSILEEMSKAERSGALLVLTDGQVSNEREVIAQCERHKAHARVFTFGIGSGVGESLVRDMARVSGGAMELIHTGERIEPKVLRAAKMLGQASVTVKEVTIDGRAVELADGRPSLFYGESVTFYGSLAASPLELSALPKTLVVTSEEGRWEVPLALIPASEQSPVGPLWARAKIRNLERLVNPMLHEEFKAQLQVVDLATRYGLMSSQTSFVVVEERAEGERVAGEAARRPVPLMTLSDHSRARSHRQSDMDFNSLFAHFYAPRSSAVGGIVSAVMPRFAAVATSAPAASQPPKEKKASRRSKKAQGDRVYSMAPSASKRFNEAYSDGYSDSYFDMPSAPPSLSPLDPLDELLSLLELQEASGRFVWGRALEALLGARAAQVKAEERADELRVTALALALLRDRFSQFAEVWEVVSQKSTSALGDSAAALLGWAEGILKG